MDSASLRFGTPVKDQHVIQYLTCERIIEYKKVKAASSVSEALRSLKLCKLNLTVFDTFLMWH